MNYWRVPSFQPLNASSNIFVESHLAISDSLFNATAVATQPSRPLFTLGIRSSAPNRTSSSKPLSGDLTLLTLLDHPVDAPGDGSDLPQKHERQRPCGHLGNPCVLGALTRYPRPHHLSGSIDVTHVAPEETSRRMVRQESQAPPTTQCGHRTCSKKEAPSISRHSTATTATCEGLAYPAIG